MKNLKKGRLKLEKIFEVIRNLPHFEYQNKKIIIDTGSPFSYSKTPDIVIDSKVINSFDKFPSNLSMLIPEDVSTLLGMDILKKFDIQFNKNSNTVKLFTKSNRSLTQELDVNYIENIPTITVEIDGSSISCIFDSGAHINYLDKSKIQDVVKEREEIDFHPSIGVFTTPIYIKRIRISDLVKNTEVGTLPSEFDQLLEKLRVYGIIGTNFFESNKVIFAPSRKKIYYE